MYASIDISETVTLWVDDRWCWTAGASYAVGADHSNLVTIHKTVCASADEALRRLPLLAMMVPELVALVEAMREGQD